MFLQWRRSVGDLKARIAIDRRINRLELGNFGDHRFCRDGVWELRLDFGPGYRVYYAVADSRTMLLLGGGSKRSQSRDIVRAVEWWEDWQGRS